MISTAEQFMEVQMRWLKFGSLACIVALLIAIPSAEGRQATTTPPAPGVSEGQKIGTIIKTAVTTAAPGISGFLSLLDTIWTGLGKSATDKVSKTTVTQEANKPAVVTAAKQPQVSAQQAIQPIGKVSDELAVIGRFLGPSVVATQYLIVV